MKVLQTIGEHAGTQQAGIFQYARTAEGVIIDLTVGLSANAQKLMMPHSHWEALLKALSKIKNKVFDMSDLRTFIEGHCGFDGSEAAAVVAILEHEGSFDHYGGLKGNNIYVSINLIRDY